MVDMSEKTCKDCGLTGAEELFRPNSRQCLECRKKYLRDYEEKNREKRTAQKLAWAAANADKAKKVSQKTKFKNRERVRARENRKKAVLAGAEGSHTIEEWLAVCSTARWLCVSCKQAKPLFRDHVMPLSKGGSDYIFNIQPLCRSCNSRKGDQIIDFRFAL